MYSSLATKYRPSDFSELCGQKSIVKILNRQIETKNFSNTIMLVGSSGCGKTTIARIFANKINNGLGQPIEVDGASNNGVDNVRLIVDGSIERSLDSEYKVYIIDECHMITTAGWNAFLKTIEEPPAYTIFIFCTTDPQKVPETILNRCQVYRLSKVDNSLIKSRLEYICKCEQFNYTDEGIEQIVQLAQGSMRQAISYLDKCKDYSNDITLTNVIECLGQFSYDIFLNLTNSVIDNNKQNIISIIDNLYDSGTDLKLFISNYFSFVLQLIKYCLFKNIKSTTIPESLEEKVKYCTGIENNVEWFNKYLDKLLELKQMIKGDNDIKTTFEVVLLQK